jgi:proteic killer suppression protein
MAIVSWKHKGLKKFFMTGSTKGICPDHEAKLRRILSLLHSANSPDELRLPGFGLHQLQPPKDKIWAVSVNGNWRVTFRFERENAEIVDYRDYH